MNSFVQTFVIFLSSAKEYNCSQKMVLDLIPKNPQGKILSLDISHRANFKGKLAGKITKYSVKLQKEVL